ncbi:MAG: pantoate kinase [Promethearchaeota archaeon]
MKARAFSPAGISSFFQACLWDSKGELLKDPALIGSRGGGIVIKKGVITELEAVPSDKTTIKVFINNKLTPNAHTTKTAVELVLKEIELAYEVTIKHQIEVPISAGYGTSGAGALSSVIALNELLELKLSKHDIGRIAHIAEVVCHTGLGSVSGILNGGLVLVKVPGVDGLLKIEHIPINSKWRVVTALVSPIRTRGVISSHEALRKINEYGEITLRSIIENPTVDHFFKSCKDFAINTGLMSVLIKKMTDAAVENGALGATQNMIGDGMHAIVEPSFLTSVVAALGNYINKEKIIVSDIDLNGPILL